MVRWINHIVEFIEGFLLSSAHFKQIQQTENQRVSLILVLFFSFFNKSIFSIDHANQLISQLRCNRRSSTADAHTFSQMYALSHSYPS